MHYYDGTDTWTVANAMSGSAIPAGCTVLWFHHWWLVHFIQWKLRDLLCMN